MWPRRLSALNPPLGSAALRLQVRLAKLLAPVSSDVQGGPAKVKPLNFAGNI